MGEQHFQQQFDDLVRQKQAEENTYLRDTFETSEIQRHLNLSDERAEKLHHEQEKKYYEQLAGEGVSLEMADFAQKQSLVPAVNDTGLSKKRKEKLKNRTKKELEKGRQIVGDYATAQTIPLMRSLRKNAQALKKQREKQKEDEKADIIALADLVIPADLFDLEITEKHSHFDVKKALKIKDSLDRIERYKAANSFEYFLFDSDVQARLDALLLCKPVFERTLTVALAANGVSLEREGEKLTGDEIKGARREYYGVTEAYKARMTDFQRIADSEKDKTKNMVREIQPTQGRIVDRKKRIRARIIEEWESFNDPDYSFVDETKAVPDSFKTKQGNGYDRSLHRMVMGGEDTTSQEEARQKSYKAIKMSMLSEKLSTSGPQPAENLEKLRQYKELVKPYLDEYKQKAPEMLVFLQDATLEQILERYDEFVAFEIGFQSFADYLNVTDTNGEKLKETLSESKQEYLMLSNQMTVLSNIRKIVDTVLALKRLSYGDDIPYEELSPNLQNVTEMKKGKIITPLLKSTDEDRIKKLKTALLKIQGNLKSCEMGLINTQAQEKKRIEERIRLDREIEEEKKIADKNGQTILERQMAEYQEGMTRQTSTEETEEGARKTVDLGELKRMYYASGLKPKGVIGSVERGSSNHEFNEAIRELFGNPAYEKEGADIATISIKDVRYEDFVQIFKKVQIPSETGDGITERVEVDREALMNLLKPVLEFDPDKYWKGVGRDVFSSMKKRHEVAKQKYKELHRFTSLTQWTDKMDLTPFLEDHVLKKIDQKRDMFTTVTRYITDIDNPEVTEKEFFERELPFFSDAVEATIHRQELESKCNEAVSEYMQAHPQVGYERTRLSKFGYGGPQVGFYGKEVEREDKIVLPVSEEEMEKIENVDSEFIKQLASEISEFSLVTRIGRRRVLFDDSVKDLMRTGKEDLKYYAEFDRRARMIAMATVLDKEGVKRALGDKADEVLKACRRIMGVYRSLEQKMKDSQTHASAVRVTMEKEGGGSVEDVKLEREAQRKPFEYTGFSKRKSWDLGTRG